MENRSEQSEFRVQASKMIYIMFGHGLALVFLVHILLAIISGSYSIQLISFLLVTIVVFVILGLGAFAQITYTRYTVDKNKLKIKVGLRKEVEIKWKNIEEIRHVPFGPFYKHQFKFLVKEGTTSREVRLNLSFIDVQDFKRVILNIAPEGGCVSKFFQDYNV